MKNKKIIIVLIVLILIVALALGLYIKNEMERVEKFSNIKILDSYEEEITNYQENKMPFTIQKENDSQTIKVNGKAYVENQRFYEVGKYKIEVIENGKRENATVYIKNIDASKEHTYNIYVVTTTLQTLMASLDIASTDDLQGYFWTQKNTSVDVDSMQKNAKNLTLSNYLGSNDEKQFKSDIIKEIKSYVKETLQSDEDAYFNLYIEDYRFYLELELFGKIGLGDHRYNVTIYSDGTSSYVKEFSISNFYYKREYRIREENGYETLKEEKVNYNNIVTGIRNNTYAYNDMPGSYLVREDYDNYNYDYLLISTLRDNVKYLLQFPQMLDYKDEKAEKEMESANILKIDLREEYTSLTQEQEEIFLSNIKLDKQTLDETYFIDEDANYLVITGTKPYYGTITQEKFEELITSVCNDYSGQYTILYKPHPSALPDEEQQAFLDSLNIKTLPGTIPMEAIMFIYPNIKLGGFGSSLYMSAKEGQTEFFFANSKDDLVEPLCQLYDELFSNAKFYTLTDEEETKYKIE